MNDDQQIVELAKRISKIRDVWVFEIHDGAGRFRVIRFEPLPEILAIYYFPKVKK